LLPGRFFEILIGDDVVTIKHTPGLETRDFHRHSLRHSRSDHVSYCGSPEIVEEPSFKSNGLAGSISSISKIPDWFTIPVKEVGTAQIDLLENTS